MFVPKGDLVTILPTEIGPADYVSWAGKWEPFTRRPVAVPGGTRLTLLNGVVFTAGPNCRLTVIRPFGPLYPLANRVYI